MLGRVTDLLEKRDFSPATLELINNIFEQSVSFLEAQSSIWPEHLNKLFEKLFFLSKGKSVALKKKVFQVFEKFNGTSLFKKIYFYL